MTAPRRVPDAQGSGGFVLVGVAMFVLVLTILGLSLFSLSSFESQFFQRSYRGSRAFYDAMGGLDRARWVLTTTDTMSHVSQFLPAGIEAGAYQVKGGNLDSVGAVTWGGNDVLIRVTATRGDVRQTVQAQFVPATRSDYYKRLMTLSGMGSGPDSGLVVIKTSPGGDTRWTQTVLQGDVWQNPAGPSPLCDQYVTSSPIPTLSFTRGGVQPPQLRSYWADHQHLAPEVYPNALHTYDLRALGEPDDVKFFKTPWGGGDWSFADNRASASDPNDIHISVSGTCIWMFEGGLLTDRMVRVTGVGVPTEDVLVLIGVDSHSSQEHHGTELALLGGLDSPTVPVILVASDRIKLQHVAADPANDKSGLVPYLSIYARSVELMGPALSLVPPHLMTLAHPLNAIPDQLGGAVDRLYQLGILPNMDAGESHVLPMRAGTWHQVTLNN